jgi:serine/threonine protein kinase
MMQLWLQESRFDRLRMISLKERIRGQLKTNFRSILTRSRVPPSEEHSEADVQLVLDFLQAFESPHLKPEQAVEKKPRTQSFDELYSLGRKIGEGAHAVVKECIEKESGVKLAVKILRSGDEEIVSNFKQTYRMAMEFKHPNLSSMRHLFIDPEREVCHLVMELVPYPSLREHL